MIKTLLVYAAGESNQSISYQQGWPKYFLRSDLFDCTPINLISATTFTKARNLLRILSRKDLDAVIILHSAFSNNCNLTGRLFEQIRKITAPKAYFIGNEYKLIPEKMAFCDELSVRLFVTQKSAPEAQALYQDRLGCNVIGLPGAGLDTEVFFPERPFCSRPIDIGFRANDEPWYFGHQERRALADHFSTNYDDQFELDIDVGHGRFSQSDYAGFLNCCKAQLATEAGKDYMELDDSTRMRVNAFVNENPEAEFKEIQNRFFVDRSPSPSGRSISGRQVEAAGTKTLQIMFEGHYSGYLLPDKHYLAVAKDFGNIDQVIARFNDPQTCATIVENAFKIATTQLTYQALIDQFHRELITIL
jgi:hypothetical protein